MTNQFDFVKNFDAENDKSRDFLLTPKTNDIPVIKNIRSSSNQPLSQSSQRRERPGLHLKYPLIVSELERFLNLHAGGAQERRRTDAVHYNGITTSQMRDHHLDIIKMLSIPAKRNDKNCKILDDSHFASAQVKYGYELASLYPQEIISLSCDNKCKIPIGSLAVSRYLFI
ncbi:unnamed protein product [Didymodactylos carnosus]|uniref:Uncharacterized protein n=1 Tax=Didymodactylos carnosus TaxID=1234261 RepID=A0A815CEQ1_9BILA|nr:unnamed protein product [Didymodactylos carnosus]CAF4079232.1 unnamed protein product [Didymodactylos carnosus]